MNKNEQKMAKRGAKIREQKEAGVPHRKTGENNPGGGAIVPRNMGEAYELLSGRNPNFREPMTRKEERAYVKVWKRKGKGYTKPVHNKHSHARKLRQQQQSRKWAEKRKQNNKKKEEDV